MHANHNALHASILVWKSDNCKTQGAKKKAFLKITLLNFLLPSFVQPLFDGRVTLSAFLPIFDKFIISFAL